MQKRKASADELITLILQGIEEVKGHHIEGEDNAEWILMDYVNVVVHVFQKQVREFYDIEGLWGDAKFTTIESSINH